MRWLLALVFVSGSAIAQPYPNKPVRWIVPVTRLYTTPLVMVVHPSLPGVT